MKKTTDLINKEFEKFIDEIDRCTTKEEAHSILSRYEKFCKENNIPLDNNYLVESGFTEALDMLL